MIPIEELRKAVWGDTRVGRGAIRVCVREIRQALGDEAATPRYIETVGRQGYRFIGRLSWRSQASAPSSPYPLRLPGALAPSRHFVGRERELAQLQQWFAQAQQGHRQVVLVSGEPGIGKTTLVEAFLQRLASGVQSLESGDHKPLLRKFRTPDPSTRP